VLKDDGGVGLRQISGVITNTFSAHHSFAGEADNTLFRHFVYRLFSSWELLLYIFCPFSMAHK